MLSITHTGSLRGEITVPGDKSISHRSVMFGSLAKGVTNIKGFLTGADCLSTIDVFRKMGVNIEQNGTEVKVCGLGLHSLKAPVDVLDCGNSGTTMRLMSGILSGQSFDSSLTGDDSIKKRPMNRVITPLSMMGASITGREGGFAPLTIKSSKLHGISYESPVSSAQVKSAVLLAGLYADGETSVTEPVLSRNHTELMLSVFGADINSDIKNRTATIKPAKELYAADINVPGDISSAAYFMVAALIIPGSEVLIKNVGINETRAGVIKVLSDMGGDITLLNVDRTGEPVADVLVRSSDLKGTVIGGEVIPTLIDELPVLAVAAAFAKGQTVIRDAAELKVKESDRIKTVTENLAAMGGDVQPTEDGMIINGTGTLSGAEIHTYGDHRIAMSFAVAGMAAYGVTSLDDSECAVISYPGFYDELNKLC